MGGTDYERKLAEIERLLNDPETEMQPDLVWRLLDEVSKSSDQMADFVTAAGGSERIGEAGGMSARP